ncbi:MAG: response regulator [bacterium]|nr:response regulator [bacterium]
MAPSKSKKTTAAQTKNKKILLVEDDTFLSGMYIAKMTMEKLDVTLATDGIEGVAVAKQMKPDLILLDLMLPKLDGYGVLRSLKKDPKTKNIPIILLTNLNQKNNIEKALKYEVEDYLIKAHYMPGEVIEKVKKIMRKRNS